MTKQTWNATQYVDHAAFVAKLGNAVVTLLNPVPDERILDLGCGDGTLTLKLAEAGACVHGIDASESMVATAKKRGLCAEVCSAEKLTIENRFDAVFSNAALHWMTDYEAVIKGVHRALKPHGRFVGEFGGQGNIAALTDAMGRVFAKHDNFGAFKNPWFFPAVEAYRQALEDGDFRVNYIKLIPRPTPLETGVREWLKIFASCITQALDAQQKELFYKEAEELLKPVLLTKKEGWVVDYVRLRFAASRV